MLHRLAAYNRSMCKLRRAAKPRSVLTHCRVVLHLSLALGLGLGTRPVPDAGASLVAMPLVLPPSPKSQV